MNKTLAWKDVRLGWKMLLLCVVIILAFPLITDIEKEQKQVMILVAGLLLLLNSSAIFRSKELDTRDFFLYALPVQRVRIVDSKQWWIVVSMLIVMLACVVSWEIIDKRDEFPDPYWSLPILFLPAIVPIVLILYFRSSQISTLVVSFVATLLWFLVAVALCPFMRLTFMDVSTYADDKAEELISAIWSKGLIDYTLILLALIFWSLYLFCRTDLTEKPHSKSALLGIEFIFLFAWFAYVILGANIGDIWYLLF